MKSPKPAETGQTLVLRAKAGKSQAALVSDMTTSAYFESASVVCNFSKNAGAIELDINETIRSLSEGAALIHEGKLGAPEAMLSSQAIALNSIFGSMARRSVSNMAGGYLDAGDRYMRLALKAQSQCRATLETLAEIKNPTTVYARQANIAHGPQQVNNGAAHAPARAEAAGNPPNKLLERRHEPSLDIGTQDTASGGNSAMETVESIDRT